VADVLSELDAPLVALQEVDSLESDGSQTDYLAQTTGLTAIAGPAIRNGKGYYGNVLLTRYPVIQNECFDISVHRWEPRCIINAVVNVDGVAVRVLVTHLGLRAAERRSQVDRLLKICSSNSDELLLVAGDINEWAPLSPRIRALDACFGKLPAPRTFPSFLPLVALDRIWVKPKTVLRSIRVHKSWHARIASDHLPIVAELAFAPATLAGAQDGETRL